MKFSLLVRIPLAFFLCSCQNDNSTGFFVDSRDQQSYAWIKIGSQIWMAQNLNFIPSNHQSWCYDDQDEHCQEYGRLYDWVTATQLPDSCANKSCQNLLQTQHQGICPKGWHLPSAQDWIILDQFTGGQKNDSTHLEHWNQFGFHAVNSGYFSGHFYHALGLFGYYWSSSQGTATDAHFKSTEYDGDDDYEFNVKSYGYSIRCLKNQR